MATSSFNIGDLNSDIAALNGKINVQLITSATDLNNLTTDNYRTIKHYTGDTCAILTNAPSANAVPWELEVGCIGTNINYQYQEFRLYQSNTDSAGSKIYRRQKYYYGVGDFRWNDWVSYGNERVALDAGATGVATNGYVCRMGNSVRVYGTARSSSDIGTNTILAYIPSGFRPKANASIMCMITNAAGVSAYFGTVHPDGHITQALTSSARDVLFVGEYLT